MTDTIIKGSGNSRSIKSVPNLATLAPTYDKLLELLTGEGLPVDILGLNPSGVDVRGTDLTKPNLLSDATESAIWGSVANRTPNQALAQLRTLIQTAQNTADGKAKIRLISYVGTGETTTSISVDFEPKFVYLVGRYSSSIRVNISIIYNNCPMHFVFSTTTASSASYGTAYQYSNGMLSNLPSLTNYNYTFVAIG